MDMVLNAGFAADYLLMDSWFTHMPLLRWIAAVCYWELTTLRMAP